MDDLFAAERAERNRERRSAVVVQRPDAGWTVHAELDETAWKLNAILEALALG